MLALAGPLLALHLAFFVLTRLFRRELLGVRVEGEGGERAGVGVERRAAGGHGGDSREGPEVSDGGHDVAEEVGASLADFGRVRREMDVALQEE